MLTLHKHGYTACILPERGGSCVRLSRWGAEALRTPKDENAYRKDNPFLYGTPPLFPPNRIAGAHFLFEGREYRFPVNEEKTGCFLHGTLHETPLVVIDASEDEARMSLSFTTQRPYLTFPHAFTFQMAYSLNENGLTQRAMFTNDSPLNMPVAFALHTTFNIPFAQGSAPENVRLTLDTAAEYGRSKDTYLPDGSEDARHPLKEALDNGALIPCEHSLSRLYSMGDRREMILTDEISGLRVRCTASAPYGYWMLFNAETRDYLCVEPQSWLTNAPSAPFPREKTGFAFLRPKETAVYQTLIAIEKI